MTKLEYLKAVLDATEAAVRDALVTNAHALDAYIAELKKVEANKRK